MAQFVLLVSGDDVDRASAGEGSFLLSAKGPSSTSVTFALDLQPRGLMKLMGPMVERQMQKEVAALSDLKRVLEGS